MIKFYSFKWTRRISIFGLIVSGFAMNQMMFAQYACLPNGAPVVTTGSIAAGDPNQTSRVFRDGIPSSCTGGVPTQAPLAGSYRYDAHNFVNPTGQAACVVAHLDATGCALNSTQINAYSTFNPANVSSGLIGKPGFSTTGRGSFAFPIAAGGAFTITVHEVVAGSGCPNYTLRVTYHTDCRQSGFDRTNDGKADPAYWRPSDGTWNIIDSAGGTSSRQFGLSSDIITAADYTGDNLTDLSTYRPSANTWFYASSQIDPANNSVFVPWGLSGDIPVPGDYDRDGKADFALFRPSVGNWYTYLSATNTVRSLHWGQNGDIPVSGDYDGDLIADMGVVRPVGADLRWFILQSNFDNGFVLGCPTSTPICALGAGNFGLITDRVVTGDFDGDLRSDIAVFRPADGFWWFRSSVTTTVGNGLGATRAGQWGMVGDIPQPADFDGDKKTDIAVYRPSVGEWYILNSATTTLSAYAWGTSSDQPASSPYRITNP